MTPDLWDHLLERRSMIPSTMPFIHQQIIWQAGQDHSSLQLMRNDYLEGLLYALDASTGERNVFGAHAVAYYETLPSGNLSAIDSGN